MQVIVLYQYIVCVSSILMVYFNGPPAANILPSFLPMKGKSNHRRTMSHTKHYFSFVVAES